MDDQKPTIYFSVIITAYNRENLILETLETVLNQSYKNFEIIIIDDCSSDNTVEVLKPYQNNGLIKLFVNDKNMERCYSRNRGIENASGDYLTFLDSDDFMYEDCLKDAANYLSQNPESQFFHNYYELVDNDRNVIYNYQFPSKGKTIKSLAEGNFISCIGNFISREVYSQYKFSLDPIVLGSEDWELWLRVASNYKLGVIPKVNHGVRNHQKRSVNSLDYSKIIKTKLYIIDSLFNSNEAFKTKFGPHKKFMKASAYLFGAVGANKYYNFSTAQKYIFSAIKSYPKILFTERFLRVFRVSFFRIKKDY